MCASHRRASTLGQSELLGDQFAFVVEKEVIEIIFFDRQSGKMTQCEVGLQ